MSKEFNVFIKLANSKTLTLDINYEMSVKDLINKIKEKLSQQSNQFDDVFISVGAKIISEDHHNLKITDFKIHKDSTIFIIPRLRGGD